MLFDSLTCSGEEDAILQCNFSAGDSCAQLRDVGVRCSGEYENTTAVSLIKLLFHNFSISLQRSAVLKAVSG